MKEDEELETSKVGTLHGGSADCKSEKATKTNASSADEDSGAGSSSEGKSGSGGGYSADCSASDQESDECNEGKPKVEETMQALDTLEIAEGKNDAASTKKQDQHENHDKVPSTRAIDGGHDITEQSSKEHRNHRQVQSSKTTSLGSNIAAAADPSNSNNDVGIVSSQPPTAPSEDFRFPFESPGIIDIDTILRWKTQQDRENSTFFSGCAFLPQWNGVRVGNPMDPRIDLSLVSVLPRGVSPSDMNYCNSSTSVAANDHASPFSTAATAEKGSNFAGKEQPSSDGRLRADITSSAHTNEDKTTNSIDNYVKLMEMVRPFFLSHGVPFMQNQPEVSAQQGQLSSEKTDSSEGFTSFFTTTHSSQQSGSSSEDKRNTSQMKQNLEKRDTNSSKRQAEERKKFLMIKADKNEGKEEEDMNKSDSSSMVVLARIKSKHKKGEAEAVGSAEEEQELEVRIQEGRMAQHLPGVGGREDDMEDTEVSSSSGAAPKQAQDALLASTGVSGAGIEKNPESSASSASAREDRGEGVEEGAENFHQNRVPFRIVTDVSSSNRTDSGPNTSSGSGSGANTGSGTGSGQGSSGSGNEGKASSEEGGKGSSGEDGNEKPLVGNQGNGSGDSPLEASDQSDSKKPAIASMDHGHHQESEKSPATMDGTKSESLFKNNNAIRERKLLDKKRKRIEMRREYEAQQHLESSESSDQKSEVLLRPGKPVTFDQVLLFSNIARLVVQSSPPFLVVHSNAAFTRLSGIHSHKVVGRPIRSVLSLATDEKNQQAGEENSSFSGNPQSNEIDGTNELARSHNISNTTNDVERLVAAGGFGRLHIVQLITKHSQIVGKSVAFLKDSRMAPPARPRPHQQVAVAASRGNTNANNDHSLSSGGITSSANASPTTRRVFCRASIAPIVSSLDLPVAHAAAEDDVATDSKRRKTQPCNDFSHASSRRSVFVANQHEVYGNDAKRRKTDASNHPLSNRDQRQLVTHYVIQLEQAGLLNDGSLDSLSSHSLSVEARLLGLSKEEAIQHRGVRAVAREVESPAAVLGREEEEVESESSATTTKGAVAAIA